MALLTAKEAQQYTDNFGDVEALEEVWSKSEEWARFCGVNSLSDIMNIYYHGVEHSDEACIFAEQLLAWVNVFVDEFELQDLVIATP